MPLTPRHCSISICRGTFASFAKPMSSSLRLLSSTSRCNSDGRDPFARPGPPPLPPNEQREFERLIKEKANKLQFQPASQQASGISQEEGGGGGGDSSAIHPQNRPKPQPDFQGDTNPQTGEIGGPKKNPLQWENEWTYGGRATDF